MMVIPTGTKKADLRSLLNTATADKPARCAVAQPGKGNHAILLLSKTKQGQGLVGELRKQFPDAKNFRIGTAYPDKSRRNDEDGPAPTDIDGKLIVFSLDKSGGGFAKRLAQTLILNRTGFSKVTLTFEDGAEPEHAAEHEPEGEADDEEEEDSDGGDDGDVESDEAAADDGEADEAEAGPDPAILRTRLATLIKEVGAPGGDPARKAALAKLLGNAAAALKADDLSGAARLIAALEGALGGAPAASGPGPAAEQAKVAAATAKIEPLLQAAIQAAPGERARLMALWAYARDKAAAGDFHDSLTALAGLARLIGEIHPHGERVDPPREPAMTSDEERVAIGGIKTWLRKRAEKKRAKRSALEGQIDEIEASEPAPPTNPESTIEPPLDPDSDAAPTATVPPPETKKARRSRLRRELRQAQVFGPIHEQRATEQLAAHDAPDRVRIEAVIARANPTQAKFVKKAVGAGYGPDEIEKFFATIEDKDDQWLLTNLQVTGSPKNTGIQQQFVMSCQATVAQSVRAMSDPIYAAWLHDVAGQPINQVNPDVTTELAQDQRDMLERPYASGAAGGVARSLAAFEDALAQGGAVDRGAGRGAYDLLDAQADVTGLTFKKKAFPVDGDARKAEIAGIEAKLLEGKPVPLAVGDASAPMHAVVIVAVVAGPPKTFYIHDPGGGKTVARTERQIRRNKLALPSGWNHVVRVFEPD
jgi:hypothetical protein